MKLTLILSLILSGLPTFAEDKPADRNPPIPIPWAHQDIGTAQIPGTAVHADGVFTVAGTNDSWGPADGPHIVWQKVTGDLEFVARVVSMDNPGKVAHAKASLTIRESLDAGARQVSICLTATDGAQFTYREKKDDKTVHPKIAKDAAKSPVEKAVFPVWLKITRAGNEFIGFESADGKTWHKTDQIKLEIPADAIIGLTVSSHKADVLTTAKFDQVKLTVSPAK